jgi:transposase-like protein
VLVSQRRDAAAARQFFHRAIDLTNLTKVTPVEVVTDRAAGYPKVLDELAPAARHRTEQGTASSSTPTTASKPTLGS